jgi:hypothetical protein
MDRDTARLKREQKERRMEDFKLLCRCHIAAWILKYGTGYRETWWNDPAGSHYHQVFAAPEDNPLAPKDLPPERFIMLVAGIPPEESEDGRQVMPLLQTMKADAEWFREQCVELHLSEDPNEVVCLYNPWLESLTIIPIQDYYQVAVPF